MLQPSHRGIYEFLWSEHKYPVMGVSLKSFLAMASRLGRRPQILALLKKIADYAFEEKTENYNALLNSYLHVKPGLSRSRRQELIETILADADTAARMIYEEGLAAEEKSLAGCRLFFPRELAIYKFWDGQGRPGLWHCFGPFQLHLTPQQAFSRLSIESGVSPAELLPRLALLKKGISIEQFSEWPENFRRQLMLSNMVAIPGGQAAYLHPRIQPDQLMPVAEPLSLDILSTAALALARLWDNSEYIPEVIAQLPDYHEFINCFSSDSLPAVVWSGNFSAAEAFDMLGHLFWLQQAKDNGVKFDENEEESGACVGMETADEEIDPEEGEHCDDEPCD